MFYYAVTCLTMMGTQTNHILTVSKNDNLVKLIKDCNAIFVTPCKTRKEAIVLVEFWNKHRQPLPVE